MKRDVRQDGGAHGVKNVICGPAFVHPLHLVAGLGNKNHQRTGEGRHLSRQNNVHRIIIVRRNPYPKTTRAAAV